MNETMRDLLLDIVCDAFEAGVVSDEAHDEAIEYLNGVEVQ